MLEKINHIAIAVPNLEQATKRYRDHLNCIVSEPQKLPEHGVTVVFIEFENSRVELLEPLGDHSPIASFLKKNPDGGQHHICYEVSDLKQAIIQLKKSNIRILGDGQPKIGAHGNPVVFLHPKDCMGTLIELEEIKHV
ncbi:MAG: methylmalonyl-CoA epimerase [Pseudomonadota bacterium]